MEVTVTFHNPASDRPESVSLASTTSIADCLEFARALLGMEGDLILVKDGKKLTGSSLAEAGVVNGDLLLVMKAKEPPVPRVAAPAATPTGASAGGLDFSNLLAAAPSQAPIGGGSGVPSVASGAHPPPVYYDGMNLSEAIASNQHPTTFVQLLQQHSHLSKELNFHMPSLARELQAKPLEEASKIWRDHIVKGSISRAFYTVKKLRTEGDFQKRLAENPNDPEAIAYFDKKRKQKIVDEQLEQAKEHFPGHMAPVTMLYIEAKVNHQKIQAFVDSGAQTSIMSKKCAKRLGVLDYVDERLAGTAIGVGTQKILGRIHILQLQVGDQYFLCSVSVLDDHAPAPAGSSDVTKGKDMDFLLGLDMLKRHTCCIDLSKGVLKFGLGAGQFLETPFLHEKDLDESKGGTLGFDAEKANQELEEAQRKYLEDQEKGDGGDDMEE